MSWITQSWTTGQLNALVKKIGEKNARGILDDTVRFSVQAVSLLRQVSAVDVNAVERFVAKDQLLWANVSWTGKNFDCLFLDKVEIDVPAGEIAIHKPEKSSLDRFFITAELGEKAEIYLAHFFELLHKQAKREKGDPPLTNGRAIIAYVCGVDGKLWTVYATWNDVYRNWQVDCSVEEILDGLGGRIQVLSRN